MSSPSSKSPPIQSPKGTRDFYPADMAQRRWLEGVWREVSIRHGFDEVEGPTFESIDLYKKKSGEGIVSEMFGVFSGKDEAERRAIREGADAPFALRPEFTPTLARMFAARAGSLPSPAKWFCIPTHYRAERPQRGRLREFIQWNVDMIGDPSPRADAEIIAVAIDVLKQLGLKSTDVTVKVNHRSLIAQAIQRAGVPDSGIETAMNLLDKRDKVERAEFDRQCAAASFDFTRFNATVEQAAAFVNGAIATLERGGVFGAPNELGASVDDLVALCRDLAARGILNWCEFSPSIVRGLAYYTGMVFEIHEARGKERAIAGGGRYDKLIELFGGPPTPACGFAMGDVVIRLVLEEKGLLPAGEQCLPRPDLFVISNGESGPEARLPQLVSQWRGEGLHVRHTYKSTRNVGKLLGEAGKCRSRFAVILGAELASGRVTIKNLDTGSQEEIAIDQVNSVAHASRL